YDSAFNLKPRVRDFTLFRLSEPDIAGELEWLSQKLGVFYRSNSHAPLWVVAEKPVSGRGNVEWRIRGNFYPLPHDIRAERAGAHVIRVRADHNYELRKKP